MSHLGRPKDGPTDKYSLKHLIPHLGKLLSGTTVLFANDCIGEQAYLTASMMRPGEVLLLENLRFYKEEEKGDEDFAEKLSKLGDVYVTMHLVRRIAHMHLRQLSLNFLLPIKDMFGLLMEGEVASAEKVLHQAEKPFTAIIGGAKVSDKILDHRKPAGKRYRYYHRRRYGLYLYESPGRQNRQFALRRRPPANGPRPDKKQKTKAFVSICLPIRLLPISLMPMQTPPLAPSNNIPDGWMGLDIGECLRAVLQRDQTFQNHLMERPDGCIRNG